MDIPDGPQSLTSEWLTQALRQTGIVRGAWVTSFQAEAVGAEGEGTTGRVARLRLEYDHREPAAPQSLIAKFHSADPELRARANAVGQYLTEFRFFQQVAPQGELPSPRCYYGDYQESGLTVLLLEDLAPATSLGRDLDASLVELAIRQIAKFHALWWEHPQLDTMVGEQDPAAHQQFWAMLQHHVSENWPTVVRLAGELLPEPMLEIGQQVVNHWTQISGLLRSHAPRTLTHSDYHGDNLMFASSKGGKPFSIIDWQLATLGRGPYDPAMLIGSIPIEQRRATEMSLLQIYHQVLVENGVKEYSFEQCLQDYKLAMLDCFARLVVVIREPFPGEDLDRYRAADYKWRGVELPRRCAAILDLEAHKLIPE